MIYLDAHAVYFQNLYYNKSVYLFNLYKIHDLVLIINL